MLTHWLKKSNWIADADSHKLSGQISLFSPNTDINHFQIGLIGFSSDTDRLRESLFDYPATDPDIRMMDLGNLINPGISSLLAVTSMLQKNKIILIILGLPSALLTDYLRASSLALPSFHTLLIHNGFGLIPSLDFDQTSISLGGVQQHHLSALDHKILDNHQAQIMRLGAIKKHIEDTEPLVRLADQLIIDASSIKYADAPCQIRYGTSGLTSEEVCQISHYYGFSPNAKILIPSGFEEAQKESLSTHTQMMWYFISAVAASTHQSKSLREAPIQYIVESELINQTLKFLREPSNGMWWIDIETSAGTKRLPCSEKDYEMTLENEIPERIFKYLAL